MIDKVLGELGFSPSEIKIYLYLLQEGCSFPNKISFNTGINRTNVYEALERLRIKGIVSSISKNNIRWYEANNPKDLLILVNEKEQKLLNTKRDLENELTSLNNLVNKKTLVLEANIFVGKKGLRMIFENILETRSALCLIASELQWQKIFGPYFELWHNKRIKNKIIQRSIFPIKLKGDLKKRKLLTYRFIDDNYTNPTTTLIYGDNCIFIEWSKEPVAIKINNKNIVRSHLNYFEQLWKVAKS